MSMKWDREELSPILLESSPDEERYNSVTLELAEGSPSVPDVVFIVMINVRSGVQETGLRDQELHRLKKNNN